MTLEEYRKKKYYIEMNWNAQIRYLGAPGWEIKAAEYRQKMADEIAELNKEFGSENVLMYKLAGREWQQQN
jgi:uncharacterized membrane protein